MYSLLCPEYNPCFSNHVVRELICVISILSVHCETNIEAYKSAVLALGAW